ncbi:cache domain-containing protein [Sinanaerobacter chloroacetimidivorans]|uniref:histidine kinase n=1 Tax=Sinanaerobacter chloroacetimidivorans TaxID=2818044 RepID=A0A8J7W3K8_9FIRM|nr:cache domain-containing protein [Sinanaerobacter chloroacetimidivorans]MBR0598620.1 sensor histidine kinase [Sinanaerobacter chloroacetimidivorans]
MKKISSRIIFTVIACSLITSLLVGWVSLTLSKKLLESEATERVQGLADKYANETSAIFENIQGLVTALSVTINNSFDLDEFSKNPEEYHEWYKDYLDPIIADMTQRTKRISGAYFTFDPSLTKGADEIWYYWDEDGTVKSLDATADGHFLDAFEGTVEENMLYYFQPIQNGKPGWTEPVEDPDLNTNIISYSEAVYVDGQLIGVAGCDLETANTIDLIEEMKVYDTGYAFLLNDQYKFMIHQRYTKNENLSEVEGGIFEPAVKAMKENKSGVVKYEDKNGDYHIVGYSRMTNGWTIAVMPPTDEVFKPARELTVLMVVLTLLSVMLTFIISYIFSNKFSSPIRKVADELKSIGLEDFTKTLPKELLEREDEFGDVAKYAENIKGLIEKKTEENREKDVLLVEQSRLAKMGEMVGSIAHQWKQPLNNINLILANINQAYHYNELTQEYIDDSLAKVRALIVNMSATMENFLSFSKPNKNISWFSAKESLELAVDLSEESIKSKQIDIHFKMIDDFYIYGFSNEFSNAIFNILNNAIDAAAEETEKRLIDIELFKNEQPGTGIIEITNYGKRLDQETLNNMFKPFYTTKKTGTGIGLSIAKSIIEQNLSGQISVYNIESGVCCKISLNDIGGTDRNERSE